MRVAIVGLGLIGGSLGLALRRRRLAQVIGVSRRPATLRQAKRLGAIDSGTALLREAVAGADLVVLAAPVDAIETLGRHAARFMRSGSVLTDVGSSKAQIVQALGRSMPRGVAFAGAHPLAGSERRGIEAARADLFDGSICVITPTRRTPRRAREAVTRLWKPLVRRVVTMDPARHDRLLAAVSHVPHVLAFSLMRATPREALAIAPRSFLDATRVAQSDPDLWDDILLSNRAAITAAMSRFEREWRALRRAITGRDQRRLVRLLAEAQRERQTLANHGA